MTTRTTLFRIIPIGLLLALGSTATPRQHDEAADTRSPVADDVLFLVLGKMALYDQDMDGELELRNHHFVAEIMPKSGRRIVSGTLTSAADPAQVIAFNPEGNAFLAHGARVLDADELHERHPDGEYLFSYRTQSGDMRDQSLRLAIRPAIDSMPAGARITATQDGKTVSAATIDPSVELQLGWDRMQGNTRLAASELDDLVFVLVFDCFGNNVAHSGRPYQGGPYLTFRDSTFVVPADAFEPGLRYSIIVEQATADVTRFKGVPGISTYATLTFMEIQTAGDPAGDGCPAGAR